MIAVAVRSALDPDVPESTLIYRCHADHADNARAHARAPSLENVRGETLQRGSTPGTAPDGVVQDATTLSDASEYVSTKYIKILFIHLFLYYSGSSVTGHRRWVPSFGSGAVEAASHAVRSDSTDSRFPANGRCRLVSIDGFEKDVSGSSNAGRLRQILNTVNAVRIPRSSARFGSVESKSTLESVRASAFRRGVRAVTDGTGK